MNVLFICVYNRFRSRVAEALFIHHTKNQGHHAQSAGIRVDQTGYPILGVAGVVLKEQGVSVIEHGGAQQVTDELIRWADRIVIVAEEVPVSMFPAKKTVKFAFPDAYSGKEETKHTINSIDKAVIKLVKELDSLKI